MTVFKLSAIDFALNIGKYLSTMSMNLDYQELYKVESMGAYGTFGLQISVAVNLPVEQGQPAPKLDLNHETIRFAAYNAAKVIESAVMRAQIANIPQAQARAKTTREHLLGLFPQAIFVEDIPNGYCNDYCCSHLPWFIVTTAVGRIKIGWRKRVISIDWNETRGTKTSSELFASENVTKDEKGIHAWDLERAKAYVDAILSGVPLAIKAQHVIPT